MCGKTALCTVIVLWMVVPARGQAPDLDERVRDLESKTQELQRQMSTLTDHVTSVTELVRNNKTELVQNRDKLGELTSKINAQLDEQRQILEAISARDSTGSYFLRLDNIMSSSTVGREQLSRAVEESLRRSGTFKIENQMGYDQHILVNRVQYRVLAGGTLNLDVPIGTVTTQLPGQKIVNWTITAPDYNETIQIIPTHTTYRPVAPPASPIDVAPPAYVVPPWNVSPSWYYDPWFLTDYTYTDYGYVVYP